MFLWCLTDSSKSHVTKDMAHISKNMKRHYRHGKISDLVSFVTKQTSPFVFFPFKQTSAHLDHCPCGLLRHRPTCPVH